MSDVLAQALAWAADTGIPNAVFVVALLTRPSTWTKRLLDAVDQRLGGGE